MLVSLTSIYRLSHHALRTYCSSTFYVTFGRERVHHGQVAGNLWKAALPQGVRGINVRANAAFPRGLSTILEHQSTRKFYTSCVQKWAKFAAAGLGISTTAFLTWASLNDHDDALSQLRTVSLFTVRFSRDCWVVAAIALDYYRTLTGVPDGEAREAAKRACHQRGADRLQRLFFQNGGIYIKLGQHIGQLDYVLPDEYVLTMRRVMLDKCPVSPYEDVVRTFVDGFGRTPEQMFASFNREPVASASLSQVHEAVSHDGQRLAVKVQHRWLRTGMVPADVLTVELLVGLVRRLFPAYDYRWLVEEVKRNLPMELNFITEADNAGRCEANFEATGTPGFPRGSVTVPKVLRHLSCATVLAMEFVEGAPLTDADALRRMGLDPAEVADLLSAAFARMIFRHGFVHCDPHEANLLVRCLPSPTDRPSKGERPIEGQAPQDRSALPSPQGRGHRQPQLVLLDHGLYRELDDSLRVSYAGLWQAMVMADVDAIARHSASLGVGGDQYPLLAAVITKRPWDRIVERSLDHLSVPDTQADKHKLQGYAAQYREPIARLLAQIPRDLLLLLKTHDCLRAINGAQDINTFVITARECARALGDQLRESSRYSSWSGLLGCLAPRIHAAYDIWRLELRLFFMRAAAWFETLKGKRNLNVVTDAVLSADLA